MGRGVAGMGNVNVSGSNTTVTAVRIYVSQGSAAQGTFHLNDSTLNAQELHVGSGGTGITTLDGNATFVIGNWMQIAEEGNGTRGTLNIANNANVTFRAVNDDYNIGQGANNVGVVNQSGGTFTDTHVNHGWMNIGAAAARVLII